MLSCHCGIQSILSLHQREVGELSSVSVFVEEESEAGWSRRWRRGEQGWMEQEVEERRARQDGAEGGGEESMAGQSRK